MVKACDGKVVVTRRSVFLAYGNDFPIRLQHQVIGNIEPAEIRKHYAARSEAVVEASVRFIPDYGKSGIETGGRRRSSSGYDNTPVRLNLNGISPHVITRNNFAAGSKRGIEAAIRIVSG